MILIKNGIVLTMTDEKLGQSKDGRLAGQRLDILCSNGKIEQIAPGIELPESAEAEVLDAAGCMVTPGLIDAHCHVGITEEKKGMEGDDCNENVDPVTPYLRAIDAINTMDAAFDDAVRAGITSLMAGPGSSNVVGGQFVFLKTKGRRIDDLIVCAPAAMKIAFGENPKVNYSGMGKSPVTRMAIAGMLRRELFAAQKYCRERAGGRTAADRVVQSGGVGSDVVCRAEDAPANTAPDFDLEPWVPVFARQIPLKAHVHRVDDIFTAIRIAKEYGLRMTLDHCSEGHLIAEEIAASGFPAIVGPDLSSRSKIEIQNVDFKTSGVLQKAGVMVAICTDHPVSTIQSLPLCAGLAVKAGLPMYAGLEAITCSAAKICGVYDRVGSLERGKDADIAVFTGNPMEVFSQVRYTVIDGRLAYRQDRP